MKVKLPCDRDAADSLTRLRLRMIHEVESFLQAGVGRADWRRMIPTRPTHTPNAAAAPQASDRGTMTAPVAPRQESGLC